MVTRLRSGSLGLSYEPSTCHMHPVHNCHHIKSCHRPVKQYIMTQSLDASQYRVYIPVHYFSLVIPSPPQKYPCLPCSLPSLLPCSSIRSVAPSLPAPSFLRSLSPSFLSLAPSMPRFIPSSLVPFQAWYLCRVLTVWRRLLLTLPQPSLPTSTPAPLLSHIIASSLPSSLPLLPPSLPPSILPRPFPVSHHRSLPPAPCSLRPSHLLFSLSPSLPLAARLPPAVQLNIHRVCIQCWWAALGIV